MSIVGLDGLILFSLDLWLRIPRECICNAANILILVCSDLQMFVCTLKIQLLNLNIVSIEVACKMQNCNLNINVRKN